MRISGKTFSEKIGHKSELVPIWECEFCGFRSENMEEVVACERACYHKEEYMAGDL